MAHAVEHDRADRDLALVGLAARLGGDDAREQLHVAVVAAAPRAAASAAGGGNAERGERQVADLPVGGEPVFALEPAHGRLGAAAVDPVDRAGIIAPGLQSPLDLGHGRAAGAALVQIGVRAGDERDGEHVHREEHGEREQQLSLFFAHVRSPQNKKILTEKSVRIFEKYAC